MTKRMRNFVRGVGSILDIAPKSRAYKHAYTNKDSDRLQDDLERVGRDMCNVIGRTDVKRKPRNAA